jgi:hypothetical protein
MKSRLTGRRVNRFGDPHDGTIDWLGKWRMDDGCGAGEKCTVAGEVNSAFSLDFISQARAEQNLDAVSALLLSLAEGLISPRNQRRDIIIPFPAD